MLNDYWIPNREKIGEMQIVTNWDWRNTTLFTSKLYRDIKNKKIQFELKAKPGSLIVEFIIAASSGLTAAIVYGILQYIWRRMNKEGQKGKTLQPVEVKISNHVYVVTGRKTDRFPGFEPQNESILEFKEDEPKRLP